jgi:hypothetical protein
VLEQLRAALALPEAWSVSVPGGSGVMLSSDEAAEGELVLAPDGRLGVSQRVVPLGLQIDRADPFEILGGYHTFDIVPAASGMASTGSLTDWFAPSSYVALGPREKLSAPSFESLKSGIEFGGGTPSAGPARAVTLEYEQILRDPELRAGDETLDRMDLQADPRFGIISTAAVAHGHTGFSIAAADTPVAVRAPRFVAADRFTGAERAGTGTWTGARLTTAGRDPGVTIVPSWELTP